MPSSVKIAPRSLCLLFSAAGLVLSTGCQQMKQDMESWAKQNSLKGTQGSSIAGSITKCPPGTRPLRRPDGDGGIDACVSLPGVLGGSNRASERYANGALKSDMFHKGDALRVVHYYQNGNTKEETHYLNAAKNGLHTEWFENGQIKKQENFKDGTLHGSYLERRQSGKLKERGLYANGQKSGLWVKHAEDGKLVSRAMFAFDKKNGNAEEYTQEGTLQAHGAYLNDQRNGRWVLYHPNGKRKSEGNYLKSAQDGKWLNYDSTGKQIASSWYKNGVYSEPPRLAANVKFEAGDVLGARPPIAQRAPRPRAQPRKDNGAFEKGRGWSSF